MALINELITLGVGTPATIPHFLLFGLNPNPQASGGSGDQVLNLGQENSLNVSLQPTLGGLLSW